MWGSGVQQPLSGGPEDQFCISLRTPTPLRRSHPATLRDDSLLPRRKDKTHVERLHDVSTYSGTSLTPVSYCKTSSAIDVTSPRNRTPTSCNKCLFAAAYVNGHNTPPFGHDALAAAAASRMSAGALSLSLQRRRSIGAPAQAVDTHSGASARILHLTSLCEPCSNTDCLPDQNLN